jgi:hypothetical protein
MLQTEGTKHTVPLLDEWGNYNLKNQRDEEKKKSLTSTREQVIQ